jgi:hypothetical protein
MRGCSKPEQDDPYSLAPGKRPSAAGIRHPGVPPMKWVVWFVISFALVDCAIAGTISGKDALALATLVAEQSPNVAAIDKKALAKLRDGRSSVDGPSDKKIDIAANSISCKMSRYEAPEFSCELAFDAKTVKTLGRKAEELYDALPPDVASGAMGEYFGDLINLNCVVEPAKARQGAEGSAKCAYDPAGRPLRK